MSGGRVGKARLCATGICLLVVLCIAAVLLLAGAAGNGRETVSVRSYRLEASFAPQSASMIVRADCRIRAESGTGQSVCFLLNRKMRIERLTDGSSNLPYTTEQSACPPEAMRIICRLPHAPAKGEELTLHLLASCEANPSGSADPDWMGIVLIRPSEIRITQQSCWYPLFEMGDAPMAYCRAPAEVIVHTPADFSVLSVGTLRQVTSDDRGKTHVWASSEPAMYALIGRTWPLATINGDDGGTMYMLCAPEREPICRTLLTEASRTRAYYSKHFGPPLQSACGVAEMSVINSRYSYNYSAGTYVVFPESLLGLNGGQPTPNLLAKLAHETAHSWFPGTAAGTGPGWRFLTEGFAEYMARCYMADQHGADQVQNQYARDMDQLSGQAGGDSLQASSRIAYTRGPWLLRMLEQSVNVREAMKQVAQQHRGAMFTADEFWSACQAAGGSVDAIAAFRQYWFAGTAVPEVRYDYSYHPASDGGYVVDISVQCSQGPEGLTVPFRIVTTAEPHDIQCAVSGTGRVQTRVASRPLYVTMDPDVRLLTSRPWLVGDLLWKLESINKTVNAAPQDLPGLQAAVSSLEMPLKSLSVPRHLETFRKASGASALPRGSTDYLLAVDWQKGMNDDAWRQLEAQYEPLLEFMRASRSDLRSRPSEVDLAGVQQQLGDRLTRFIAAARNNRRPATDWSPELLVHAQAATEAGAPLRITDLPKDVERISVLDTSAQGDVLVRLSGRRGYRLLLYRLEGDSLVSPREVPVGDGRLIREARYVGADSIAIATDSARQIVLWNARTNARQQVELPIYCASISSAGQLSQCYGAVEDAWKGGDIATLDLDGRTHRILVGGEDDQQYPAISPNGSQLVFCQRPPKRALASRRPYELHLYDVATGKVEALGVFGAQPRWSSDGRYIAYTDMGRAYCLELQTREARKLSDAGRSPVWVQGSHRLIFTSSASTQELRTVDLDAMDAQ